MKIRNVGLIVVLAWAGGVCFAAPKAKPPVNQEQKDEGFRKLFETVFAQWDKNHDGKLDLKEVNAVIEDPTIHGNESAIAVVFHRRLHSDDPTEHKTMTLEQATALGNDKQVQDAVKRHAWHIQAINHALFIGGDPNLGTFHQGGIGDCYLLAVIGAEVHQRPDTVRSMIQPRAEGGYDVHFGNGHVVPVEPITDAELVMGATEGRDHGVWLSVLEKAYAHISREAKEAKTGHAIDANEAVATDYIGHAGYYAPAMARLTGHQTAGAPLGKWLKEDPDHAAEKFGELLTKLTAEHRLMAMCTQGNKTLPKGLPHGHVFAVLGYHPANHLVRVFNPWGNHFTPKGPAGLVNGYATAHGQFDVPIADMFQIFGGFTYETDKPVKR